jgi:hypothetical protein
MPRMAPEVSPAPRKKKPAIGSTEPMALKAKTKPSVMWSALASSMGRGPWAARAASIIQHGGRAADQRAAAPPLGSESR